MTMAYLGTSPHQISQLQPLDELAEDGEMELTFPVDFEQEVVWRRHRHRMKRYAPENEVVGVMRTPARPTPSSIVPIL